MSNGEHQYTQIIRILRQIEEVHIHLKQNHLNLNHNLIEHLIITITHIHTREKRFDSSVSHFFP